MNKTERIKFDDAVDCGNLELVKSLLLKYPNYPFVGIHGETLLHKAAWYGQIEMAEYFIGRGCDINAQTQPEGSTPLAYTMSGIGSANVVPAANRAMAEWLLRKGADPNLGRCLIGAIHLHDSEYPIQFVKLLVEYGADVNKCFESYRDENEMFTALDRAIFQDLPDVVEFLLSKGAKPAHEIVGVDRSLYPPVARTSQIDGVVAHFAGKYGEVEPTALIEISRMHYQ